MITNEEYARDWRWATRQIYQASKRGELCSLVTNPPLSPLHSHLYVLRLRRNKLYLEGKSKTHLRTLLEQITEVTWERSGAALKLTIEVEKRKYLLEIHTSSSLTLLANILPKNWFDAVVMFVFRRSHIAFQCRSLAQENYAEAEKWRAVFPNAEFPDINIPNAKS